MDHLDIAEDILSTFVQTPDGYRARVGQVQIARWREQLRQAAKVLTAIGNGPLLDPACRDGKCGSCVGYPCEHECHAAATGGGDIGYDDAPHTAFDSLPDVPPDGWAAR
jgi:hypothetical protein